MEKDALIYASMPVVRSWGPTNQVVWVDDGSAAPWLAQVWQCREDGELDYKPLPVVKLPSPQQQEMK